MAGNAGWCWVPLWPGMDVLARHREQSRGCAYALYPALYMSPPDDTLIPPLLRRLS